MTTPDAAIMKAIYEKTQRSPFCRCQGFSRFGYGCAESGFPGAFEIEQPALEDLKLPGRLELMAVVAVGHPAHRNQKSRSRPIEKVILLEK